MPGAQVELQQLCKTYPTHNVNALQNISLHIKPGEFVALMGPSGCGKSTLLNLIGGMDKPSSGKLIVNQQTLTQYSEAQLTSYRRETVGFVFQFFNLLPTLTVLENTMLPLQLQQHGTRKQHQETALHWLQQLGLEQRASFYPNQLSGGQMQRVAIARALIHQPQLILADEPTGNLDSQTGLEILQLLSQLCQQQNTTLIMATHSAEAATFAQRIIVLQDGQLQHA